MDTFTERHLSKWIEQTVHDDDKAATDRGIREILAQYPELIEQGYSWPEIRRLAERSGVIK